ncbi:MAG: ATPase domain-containing protein [Candidatus Thermoplasmatota archaeon]
MAIQRIPTGVQELDEILRGGIPVNNVVLLAGGSGMGKTTLTLQFLAHGAESGENGLFLSVTEPVAILERNAQEYQFIKPETFKDGRIRLLDLRAVLQRMGMGGGNEQVDGNALIEALEGIVKQYKIKRLVVDSITAICQRLESPGKIRDFIFRLGLTLSSLGCTTILTSETPPRELKYSMFGVEEFIGDGIIFLSEMERNNDLVRTLQVIKMRGTEHSRAKFMMDLSEYGISLAPLLKKFGEAKV